MNFQQSDSQTGEVYDFTSKDFFVACRQAKPSFELIQSLKQRGDCRKSLVSELVFDTQTSRLCRSMVSHLECYARQIGNL